MPLLPPLAVVTFTVDPPPGAAVLAAISNCPGGIGRKVLELPDSWTCALVLERHYAPAFVQALRDLGVERIEQRELPPANAAIPASKS